MVGYWGGSDGGRTARMGWSLLPAVPEPFLEHWPAHHHSPKDKSTVKYLVNTVVRYQDGTLYLTVWNPIFSL